MLATSVVVGAGDAGGAPPTAVSLSGACTLPQGDTAPLTATVAGTFPRSQGADAAMPDTNLSVTLTLSPSLVAGLRAAGGTSISSNAATELVARNGGTTQNLALTNLTAPKIALPGRGSLLLTGTGEVPVVTPTQPGTMDIDVAGVTPTLTVNDGSVATECTLRMPASARLASVQIAGPVRAAAQIAAAATTPPPVTTGQTIPPTDLFIKFSVTGVATLAKMHASIKLSGELDSVLNLSAQTFVGTLNLNLNNVPTSATFLGFNVLPVSAQTLFFEPGPDGTNIPVSGTVVNLNVNATANPFLKVVSSHANTTPLDVGANCQTSSPAQVTIKGPLNLIGSSKFLTTVTLPTFTGCGGPDNLDPLFDGLVSGPNNPIGTNLTIVCTNQQAVNPCGPSLPLPPLE